MYPNRREVFVEFSADKPCSVQLVVNGSATVATVTSGTDEINVGFRDIEESGEGSDKGADMPDVL
ncbi:hypothetical protein ACFVYG_07845 [Streptomyces sp. NPDC058256]|uniref:hypothetical protein n=1 Tax=Streptomyces sp. NPDC058256 TaxID=3346408 RepID=UPI0036EE6E02